jgi:arsenate reductase-like glutaredoxin family protein
MLLFSLFPGFVCRKFKKMARRQRSEYNIVQMLDECDLSDLEGVLSESDDEFIPQGDALESEDNLEVNSEESDIAGATSDVDSDEDDEFIAKSGRV